MKQYNITPEQEEFIERAYSLINSAKFPSFSKVTDTYNEVFGTRLKQTSCGSCIRSRILDLKKALDKSKTTSIHNFTKMENELNLSLSPKTAPLTVSESTRNGNDNGEVKKSQDIHETIKEVDGENS